MEYLKSNIFNYFKDIIFWKYQFHDKQIIPLSSTARFDQMANFLAIFSDLVYAQKFFHPNDFSHFKLFIQDMRMGKNSQALIQLHDLHGKTHWLKLEVYHDQHIKTSYGLVYNLTSALQNTLIDKKNNYPSLSTRETPDPKSGEKTDEDPVFTPVIQTQLTQTKDLQEALKLISDNQFDQASFDLIILIHFFKTKIKPYLSDPKYLDRIPKTALPYTNIVRTNLDLIRSPFHITEEVTNSKSPLDWAIFPPMGIKSYLAQPIFAGKNLKGILYFCSLQKNTFTPINKVNYESYINLIIDKYHELRKNNYLK